MRRVKADDWFTDSLGAIKPFESVAEVIEFRESLGDRRFDWYITKYPEGSVAEWNREHGAKGEPEKAVVEVTVTGIFVSRAVRNRTTHLSMEGDGVWRGPHSEKATATSPKPSPPL